MKGGYVKLYRSLRGHPIWAHPEYLRAFIGYLLLAAYDSRSVYVGAKRVVLGPGELASSDRELALEYGWSRSRCRAFRRYCERHELASFSVERATLDGMKQGYVVTILNWEVGQGIDAPRQTGEYPAIDTGGATFHETDRSPVNAQESSPNRQKAGGDRSLAVKSDRSPALSETGTTIGATTATTIGSVSQTLENKSKNSRQKPGTTIGATIGATIVPYSKKKEKMGVGEGARARTRLPRSEVHIDVADGGVVEVSFGLRPPTTRPLTQAGWLYDSPSRNWRSMMTPGAWQALAKVADVPPFRVVDMESKLQRLENGESTSTEMLAAYLSDRYDAAAWRQWVNKAAHRAARIAQKAMVFRALAEVRAEFRGRTLMLTIPPDAGAWTRSSVATSILELAARDAQLKIELR